MRRVVVAAADDRAAHAAARALRDAGVEVIYAGAGRSPEQLAEAALQEDADAVVAGPAALAGRVAELLRAAGAGDVPVVASAGELLSPAAPRG